MSCVEIYNEEIQDLLQGGVKLDSRRLATMGKRVIEVFSVSELYEILSTARRYRAQASTKMNAHSSRSHFVFQMSITCHNEETTLEGALNLIDLAGSERLKKSQAAGSCKKETIKINTSLS